MDIITDVPNPKERIYKCQVEVDKAEAELYKTKFELKKAWEDYWKDLGYKSGKRVIYTDSDGVQKEYEVYHTANSYFDIYPLKKDGKRSLMNSIRISESNIFRIM